MEGLLTLDAQVQDDWVQSANVAGIPPSFYSFESKVVTSPDGEFSFGVIWNSDRESRPKPSQNPSKEKTQETPACPLCVTLDGIVGDDTRNIVPANTIPGYVVIPNKFPSTLGHTLAITSGTGEEEIPMYDTRTLNGVAEDMEKVFRFSNRAGFRTFHNGKDSGASIVSHEHWHLTNFANVYEQNGQAYGLDNAEITSLPNTPGISHMPSFPFAHLIFQEDQPDRIVDFLREMQEGIGSQYDDGSIPHGIAQAENGRGILVVPTKNCMAPGLPGIGSGDMAGHIPVKTQEEFEAATYNSCVDRLDQRLYKKSDFDLRQFL